MRRRLSLAIGIAVAAASFHAAVSAQSPHGGATTAPQPGPNANAASGIVANPADPAALLKTDLLLQRQNETVVAASTRNPDHILAAANDYRFVDFPQDDFVQEQGFLTRLLARLSLRSAPARPPARATIAVGAWTGVYRSCDRGVTHIGSAVPGSPLDSSPASLASPLKAFSNYAASIGAHAETTDPTLVAGPNGQMHLFVLGFIRRADGSVLDGRMFHVSYTDRNDREGGSCFTYDYTVQFDTSAAYKSAAFPAPFLDKPSATIDKDGTLYVSYTVFDDANNSRIAVARSQDGGISWTKTMPLLSRGFLRNHGTTMAIDPLSGEVYLAWRVFYQNWPLMVISRSPNGKVFLPPSPISDEWPTRNLDQIVTKMKADRLQPFDQFNNAPGGEATARALAFPHLVAGVVNGKTRLFAVWSERADVDPASPTFGRPLATGSPRIMVSASSNGSNWTPRRAIDAGPRLENALQPGIGPIVGRPSGPQVQPAANISGTVNAQLMVAYYEARDELQAPYQNSFISGIERQMDVRVARVDPNTLQLLAPSVQVSQYALQANTPEPRLAETAPGFAAVSRNNETMYGGGFKSFFGDYLTLASSTTLVGGPSWTWASEPASVFAIWTDHRDVRFPFDPVLQAPNIYGRWDLYTPVTSPQASCANTGMRDANPYFTEIAGVIAGAPQTFKPLNIQRAFATYVANQTPVDRFFRLIILDNEAAGLNGHFKQFAPTEADDVVDIRVFGNSRHNQTVWVEPLLSNPTARLKITVQEIDRIGGSVKANGLRTSIVLNPDPNNDALTRVPATTPPFDTDLSENTETHDPSVSPGHVSTFKAHYPGISSPQIDTPQIDTHNATPQIDTPQIDTPQIDTHGVGAPQIDTHLATPQIDTNGVAAPQIDTPQIDTVAPDNGTDITYTVTNGGTTTSAYKVGFNVPNVDALINSGNYRFIVIVTKTSLTMGTMTTPGGCVPAAVPNVHVLASIPVTSTQLSQLATIKSPQIDTATAPDIATFTIAPFGGVAGQNGGDNDAYSTVLPDEIKVTLRAIRMKPLADIAAANGPIFKPNEVLIRVDAQSTNVINGQVQAPGSQPAETAAVQPDLRFADYAAASPALAAAPATQVPVSAFTVQNDGGGINLGNGSVQVGYYLSTDPVITSADRALSTRPLSGLLGAGGTLALTSQLVTIPADVAPGNYYIGVLADSANVLAESNEANNYASEPIFVLPPTFGGVITDPAGDAAGGPDLVAGSVSIEGLNARLTVRFAPGTFNPATTVAQFVLDTDQNPQTGQQGTDAGCVGDNGLIGAEYLVDFGSPAVHGSQATVATFTGPGCNIFGVSTVTGSVTYSADGLDAVIPLSTLGNDDGRLNYKVVTFSYLPQNAPAVTFSGIQDRMSDVGAAVGVSGGVREWTAASGGNGHFYEYVRIPGSWTAAKAAAELRYFRGVQGHLVTIGSAAENTFVVNLRDGTDLRGWIGLTDAVTAGTFAWITGEPLTYTNWNSGEPNGQTPAEDYVEMFATGVWNDNSDNPGLNQGYLVEYDAVGAPPASAGVITSVTPPGGAGGEGFLVVRGSGFPNPGTANAVVSSGQATANGFVFLSPSTTSAYWVRLPSDFPLGPATIRIVDQTTSATSNAFPITITATPGTPVITAVLNSDFLSTTTVNPGETIYVQADGIDTLGSVVRFEQLETPIDVASGTAFSSAAIGLVVQVTAPTGLAGGPVRISIRQGASAFSPSVTLTVPPPAPVSTPPAAPMESLRR
jgi:hypothetical protein